MTSANLEIQQIFDRTLSYSPARIGSPPERRNCLGLGFLQPGRAHQPHLVSATPDKGACHQHERFVDFSFVPQQPSQSAISTGMVSRHVTGPETNSTASESISLSARHVHPHPLRIRCSCHRQRHYALATPRPHEKRVPDPRFSGLTSANVDPIAPPEFDRNAPARHALHAVSDVDVRYSDQIVCVPKGRSDGGLPATTILMDEASGGVKAVVNAKALTAWRTAAGSLLATSLFIRPNIPVSSTPLTLVLFGAGQQIDAHARLFISFYGPDIITRCIIVNRSDNARLKNVIHSLQRSFPAVEVEGLCSSVTSVAGVQNAVQSADIICTATSSTSPLFPSNWVKPGAHINLIGSYTHTMKEIDAALVHRAQVILVDSKAACAKEAGELYDAGLVHVAVDGQSAITDPRVIDLGEFARVAEGGKDVRVVGEASRDITIFKSVGLGVQDVAIVSLVVKMAEEKGIGTVQLFE